MIYASSHSILLFFQSVCKAAPFSDEPDAILERERCDYTNRITYRVAISGRGTPHISDSFINGVMQCRMMW